MQIIFLSGTKCLWLQQYVNKFLVWHKKFGSAQNILEPVKGQGITNVYYVGNLPSHLYLKLDFSIGYIFLGLFLSFLDILVEFVIQEIPIFPILQMPEDHILTNEIGFEHTFRNKFPRRI